MPDRPEPLTQLGDILRAKSRFAEAVVTQRQVNDIIEPLLMFHGVAASKQILVWQGLIDHPHCAAPRALLTDAQQRQLRDMLATTAIATTLIR